MNNWKKILVVSITLQCLMLIGVLKGETGDSLHYLLPTDTVFLVSGRYAQKVFTHTMEPKQTLYSLSRFHGITMDELYFYNPEVMDGNYGPGSRIIIPVANRHIMRYRPDDFHPQRYVPVCYRVQRGETLFHIAHRVFKLPIDTLLDRNGLTDGNLKIGQALHVGWMSVDGVPPDQQRRSVLHPMWLKSLTLKRYYEQEKTTRKEYHQKGVGVFIENSKATSDLIVMHRYARIGSVVEVTNPMKKRTVYAKVVARIPPAYDANVEVVISSQVGKLLGILDRRFYVKTGYIR